MITLGARYTLEPEVDTVNPLEYTFGETCSPCWETNVQGTSLACNVVVSLSLSFAGCGLKGGDRTLGQ